MSHGTASTLALNPEGQSSLTFNVSATLASVTTYTYIVDLGRLDFNEETRWQWAYEQNANGGKVVGSTPALVPVTLSVIIKAASSDYRKEAYRILQQAVMNRKGGTLSYAPEGAGAGVLTTYYHYVASKPPRLLDEPGNRWDANADADGFYSLQVDVELMTQPLATSDPANPVTVASLGATLDNWKDASPVQTNRITVSSADLQGSFPALVRLLITPASSQRLGRVILFRRSDTDSTLADLVTLYEAEDATTVPPTSAWTEVSSASRGGGKYMRCLPPSTDGNNTAHGLRFTLTNPNEGKGRFAVFGIGYDDAESVGIWTHQVKLYSGNIAQTGVSDYYASSVKSWQTIFAGEFELPLSDLSDLTTGYDVGPYLSWYSTRASGTSEFRLDAIVLVWISDSLAAANGDGTALDVVCDDADNGILKGGVEAPDKLLIENLPGTGGVVTARAYVVASDNDIARVLQTAPRGDFVELNPGHNHLLIFLQERASGILFTDDFTDYIHNIWGPLSDMESGESWGWSADAASAETALYVEGTQARKITFDDSSLHSDQRVFSHEGGASHIDLDEDGRFTDDDFIVMALYTSDGNISPVNIYLLDDDGSGSQFYYPGGLTTLATGWNFVYIKRSEFAESVSPEWNHITGLWYDGTHTGTGDGNVLVADYWRIEKADPDAATVPNPTGDVWDFQPVGAWAITEDVTEDTPGATLACLDNGYSEKVAILDKDIPADIRCRARVCAKRDAGTVGLFWRGGAAALSSGYEEGYALALSVGGDGLSVLSYTSGVPTILYTTGFSLDTGKWYTLGVDAKGSTHRVYAALSSTLLYDDSAVFDSTYLKKSLTDATFSSGKVGFLSQSTLGRFDDLVLESTEDLVVPADQITVSGKAVFRTIAPFD